MTLKFNVARKFCFVWKRKDWKNKNFNLKWNQKLQWQFQLIGFSFGLILCRKGMRVFQNSSVNKSRKIRLGYKGHNKFLYNFCAFCQRFVATPTHINDAKFIRTTTTINNWLTFIYFIGNISRDFTHFFFSMQKRENKMP